MKSFVLHWFVLALALGLASRVIGGVRLDSWFALAVAAFVLGLVNSVVRPVLTVLTLPLTVITLGLILGSHFEKSLNNPSLNLLRCEFR